MTDNEKLIEEVETLLDDAPITNWVDGGALTDSRQLARDIVDVFEKAHTPTDDEREALDAVIEDSIERWGDEYPTPQVAAYVAADVRAAGFRRSEPKCEHGTSLTELCEHVERLVNEPQGEPSDAQVEAALEANYPGSASHGLDGWESRTVERMRAALRAAGVGVAR